MSAPAASTTAGVTVTCPLGDMAAGGSRELGIVLKTVAKRGAPFNRAAVASVTTDIHPDDTERTLTTPDPKA